MKINFIGSPCSGKTTTAAMVFADLKELGISCEFVVEQARLYIANKRYTQSKLKITNNSITLTDQDQLQILKNQIQIENIFQISCDEETILICDSSPFNSLFYMTNQTRSQESTQNTIQEIITNADVIFYAPPVDRSYEIDVNRIHDENQSKQIDILIPEIMKQVAPEVWNKVIPLTGNPKERLRQVTSVILTRRLK